MLLLAMLTVGVSLASEAKSTKHAFKAKAMKRDFSCLGCTLSCGIQGWACGNSIWEIIDNALKADACVCGNNCE